MLDPELHAIWQKYHDRDYWGDDALIAADKAVRDREQERDPGADLPTDEEIAESYDFSSQLFVQQRYAAIQRAISTCDIQWLIDNARYDQPLTLDLFALASGYAFASGERSSNKKLKEVFEQILK